MEHNQKVALIEYLSGFINESRRELLKNVLAQRTRHLTVVIEDVYQSQNASAVVRTAECLGLQELHIIENRNAYRLNPDVVKGASKWIEVNRYKEKNKNNTDICLQGLKQRSYKIAAMTLREDVIDLESLPIDEKLALCFGAEDAGLTDTAHEAADYFVKIPILGFTQSYNLSVSAGISLYQLTNNLRDSSISWQLDKEEEIDLYIEWLTKSTVNGKKLMKEFLKNYAG